MRRFRQPVLLLSLLALLLTAVAACSKPDDAASTPAPAPDFTLRTLDGEPMQLSQLRDKVVFVNLWATWCPPCRQELPTMVRFYEIYRERGVELLAVSEDTDPEAVRAMMAEYDINFPVLLDEDKRVYNAYRATGVPETHLIDRKGMIRASQLGSFDWTSPDVVQLVESLLAE